MAGHIDHGKTAIVYALTGEHTDKLAIEKERGISIELGFASTKIDTYPVSVVDMPGHERFVRTMVAGAAGIDILCLVVAADDGVMPQTREHLSIAERLGVKHGLIALSKVDTVTRETIEARKNELRTAFQNTFLRSAPIIETSTKKNIGIDALRASLKELLGSTEPKQEEKAFRLHVDRVFHRKGLGAIVTGYANGSEIRIDDDVIIEPKGTQARIKQIQTHQDELNAFRGTGRCALNLGGISYSAISRGAVIAHPDTLEPSHQLGAIFTSVANAPKIEKSTAVLLHHGASVRTARLIPLVTAHPGMATPVQLRLDQNFPVAALPGDRFIIRGFSRLADAGTTLGGGHIVLTSAPKLKPGTENAKLLTKLSTAPAEVQFSEITKLSGLSGMTPNALSKRLGCSVEKTIRLGESQAKEGKILQSFSKNGDVVAFCDSGVMAAARSSLKEQELQERVSRDLLPLLKEIARPQKPSRTPAAQKILVAFERGGATVGDTRSISKDCELSEAKTKTEVSNLLREGALIRVSKNYIVHRNVIDELKVKLLKHFESEKTLEMSQWKAITGLSRKYTVPLAEYFDSQKITLRVGTSRTLRQA